MLLLAACCPNAAIWKGAFDGESSGILTISGTPAETSSNVEITVTMDYANGLTGFTTIACGDTEFGVVLIDERDASKVGSLEGTLGDVAMGSWKAAIGDADVGEWQASRQ